MVTDTDKRRHEVIQLLEGVLLVAQLDEGEGPAGQGVLVANADRGAVGVQLAVGLVADPQAVGAEDVPRLRIVDDVEGQVQVLGVRVSGRVGEPEADARAPAGLRLLRAGAGVLGECGSSGGREHDEDRDERPAGHRSSLSFHPSFTARDSPVGSESRRAMSQVASFLYLIRCGCSASAPSRRRRSAS